MSDKLIKVVSTNRSEHNGATPSIGLIKRAATSRANKGVVRFGLQHRFLLLGETVCAKIVQGLAFSTFRAERIDDRALFGFGHRITRRIHVKLLLLLCFALKVQKGIVNRQISLLVRDNLHLEISNLLPERQDVRVGSVDRNPQVFCETDSCFGSIEDVGHHGDNAGDLVNELHSDRLLLDCAEGDEGTGGCLPQPPVTQCYQPDNALHSLRASGVAARRAFEPVSPRISSLRAGWRWLVRANARFEDSWFGAFLGAVMVFALGYMIVFVALVLG